MSIRQRLSRALLSNAYGYGITLLTQAASVPILLHAWGAELYGEWLIASAIPSYLAMSDFGLGSAVGNEMSLETARGNREAAIEAFQSVFLAVGVSGIALLTPIPLIIALFQLRSHIGLAAIGEHELAVLIGLFVLQIWLSQQFGILLAGFRCAGHYAGANALAQTLRLLEFVALSVAAVGGAGIVGSAAAMIAMRMAGTLAMAVLLRRWVPWLPIGFAAARLATVVRLLKPGLMFLAFPIAMALNVQTPLLVIGSTLGPEAVVAFSTARTVSRSIQQLMSVVNSSIWPEMSLAFGAGNIAGLRRLLRVSVAASVWIAMASAIGLALFGSALYGLWTNKMVALDPVLLDLLLLTMLCNATWFTASVLHAATNRHAGLAAAYLIANALMVPTLWLFTHYFGLRGAAVSLVLCDIAIAAYVIPTSFHLAQDRVIDAISFIFNPIALFRSIRPKTIVPQQ